MKYICLYLHVHQPHRLKEFNIFDIGNTKNYFYDPVKNHNKQVFNKVAHKSYFPMNNLLYKMLKKHEDFKLNLSITGTFIEQADLFNREVLNSFRELNKTGKLEVLSETFHHSLSSLFSKNEFIKQIEMQNDAIYKEFKQKPKYFRNTELIYSDEISQIVEDLGFEGIITEGAEKILHWRSPNYLYKTNTNKGIDLMLKNYKLSDDIAWRFSNKGWKEHPLTAEKYLHWLDNTPGDFINLFMDYETFGEHQWEDTGIFNFMESFIEKAINKGYKFINLNETKKLTTPRDKVDCPFVISWADVDRDTSAWTENTMQQDALNKIYSLEEEVLNTQDEELIKNWRYLQISDHFYYMCTKWFSDGDAHAYFSPYDSPYKAYNYFNNTLVDLKQRLTKYSSSKVLS